MKIIIDSGATKSLCCLVGDYVISEFYSDGINFSVLSEDRILDIITSIAENFKKYSLEIDEITLYAAGLPSENGLSAIKLLMKRYFPSAECNIESDLLAAARAVCGHEPGVAAILGTGSNSCAYNGREITFKVNSGGFILGDEGSAARLGKIFISDYLKELVTANIAQEFDERYHLTYQEVINKVYKNPCSPSAYLGSFAPFIIERYSDPYIRSIVDANFNDFFDRVISRYNVSSFGIIGGFAYACRDIISELANKKGLTVKAIFSSPMQGLIKYHQKG